MKPKSTSAKVTLANLMPLALTESTILLASVKLDIRDDNVKQISMTVKATLVSMAAFVSMASITTNATVITPALKAPNASSTSTSVLWSYVPTMPLALMASMTTPATVSLATR